MPSITVKVDLDEFSDDDLLEEVYMRGLGFSSGDVDDDLFALNELPWSLREKVLQYLSEKVLTQEDLDAWIKSCALR